MKLKALTFILGLLVLVSTSAWGIPPEGLEAYALLGSSRQASPVFYANVGYVNPAWASDYETFQTYFSAPIFGNNFFTYGLALTTGNKFGDRDAYFVRYDQTFRGQSLSLKLAHVDYRFINAGKNTVSLSYNASFGIGKDTSFYFVGGMYYRFSLNSWNRPAWSPTNFNTEDREYYFEGVFGTKLSYGPTFNITMDLNNRDPFYSYNGDYIAYDLTFNFITKNKLTFRITSSTRFAALFAGTADIGEQTVLLGLVY